uniref:Uncharacterized protein n=1 Tax=Lactuca sativa TaxID=4236 RepID=A0A9R1ULE4_LACSA|nr:hypothetical protein LSAT_V11C800399460 [Lactuca sativa]
MAIPREHYREYTSYTPILLLVEHISLTTGPVLQSIFRKLSSDGSLPQIEILHPDLLQGLLHDGMEVLTISNRHKRNTTHQAGDEIEVLSRNLLKISFSSNDPKPSNWDPQDPLLISGFILYKHCFRQLPDAWKEGLKHPTGGPLIGSTGHSFWTLGTIRLPLMMVSHEERGRITRIIKFFEI